MASLKSDDTFYPQFKPPQYVYFFHKGLSQSIYVFVDNLRTFKVDVLKFYVFSSPWHRKELLVILRIMSHVM